MAATCKTELLDISHKEFSKLAKLVDSIDADRALEKDDDDTSVKDVIAHRAHWIELFLGWYIDGAAGKKVYFPAEGYKWNDLKRYNSDLRKSQAEMSWATVIKTLRINYNTLTDFIESHSEKELYGGPMMGANNQWTPGRWAEAAGPSHFRSASKYVRTVLKKSK
ncbi:MAG: ClbS/DfsB family four-helix bundle protein [Hyphomicrobiales bacterium]|nr:ClbS/DfsB family four-helix bundle protein [Hyphomicrobiales bacterium]